MPVNAPARHPIPVPLTPVLLCPVLLALGLIGFSAGCRDGRPKTPVADDAPALPVDWLARAQRQCDFGELEAAAESVQNALLETPDRPDAIFLAARIEALRGNHEKAIDLSRSIPASNQRFGIKAAELRIDQLIQANHHRRATEELITLVDADPNQMLWRRRLWKQLHRVGRSQEASLQADQLCAAGEATRQQLESLIRRNDAYPNRVAKVEDVAKHFQPGLGRARWHFGQGDVQRALDSLADISSTPAPAAVALRGRLLAETQAMDELMQWHATVDDDVRQFSDYWAAIGTALMFAGKHEAATRALLEAVSRDRTDQVCYQRLYRSLTALGRDEDAGQMLQLSSQIGICDGILKDIQTAYDPSFPQKLAELLTELGRPIEAIAWFLESLPSGAVEQRRAMAQSREQLRRTPDLHQMSLNLARGMLDPADFALQPELDEVLGAAAPTREITYHNTIDLDTKPRLVEVTDSLGIDFQWYCDTEIDLELLSLYESLGGGIAVIDFDLDGNPDLYLAQGSASPPEFEATRSNLLMRNTGSRFADVTASADAGDLHYSQGIAAGDVNQDGFADLLVGEIGANRLLINNGDGTFTDHSRRMNDDRSLFTTSVAIADVDGDAIPDLLETNYLAMENAFGGPRRYPNGEYEIPGPAGETPQLDRWFRGLGDGSWTPSWLGDEKNAATGLGIIVTDMDGQRGNEIFIANDARPNHLWRHTADGFVNVAPSLGVAHGFAGLATAAMGIATGDFNRDGRFDLQVTNFFGESSNLYLQGDGGLFFDESVLYGIDQPTVPMVGFGTRAVDLNRDGWLDFLVTNGHVFDRLPDEQEFRMPPQVLMHRGDRFEGVDVDDPSGYFDGAYLGRSMATLDFDRDGRLDFVVGHLDRKLALLRNETESKGLWIQLELVGVASERDATGATVTVTRGDESWTQWMVAGDGYLASDEGVMEIALGAVGQGPTVIDVHVDWPSGERSVFQELAANRRYLVIENESQPYSR